MVCQAFQCALSLILVALSCLEASSLGHPTQRGGTPPPFIPKALPSFQRDWPALINPLASVLLSTPQKCTTPFPYPSRVRPHPHLCPVRGPSDELQGRRDPVCPMPAFQPLCLLRERSILAHTGKPGLLPTSVSTPRPESLMLSWPLPSPLCPPLPCSEASCSLFPGPPTALPGPDPSLQVLGTAFYLCAVRPPSPCLTWLTLFGFSFLNHCVESSAPAAKPSANPSGPLYTPPPLVCPSVASWVWSAPF